MFPFFDFQTILLIIVAALNTFLGMLIYAKRRNIRANQIYTLNIAFIVWWTVSMIVYRTTETNLLAWTTILYITPTFIASTFLFFSLYFPEEKLTRGRIYIPLILLGNLIIASLAASPGQVIVDVTHIPGSEPVISFGPWYLAYALYISGYFLLGLSILARKYLLLSDQVKRRQIAYLLVGYLVASTLAMTTNLTLPWFGYFDLNWLGQILTAFMVLPVTYAIFKYRLFAANAIAAEILVGSLWIFLLTQVLLAETSSQRLISGALFAAVIVIGLLLLRSVNREVRARQEIQRLAENLRKANERLKELDKLKSEFVSIASHQLRSPLTAIKGYASLLLEGSYGALAAGAQEAVNKIFESSKLMALSVDDFLNVSRIEQGRMQYDFSTFDLTRLAKDATEELQSVARNKNLELVFSAPAGGAMVSADLGKLKQVISNLIDNAIKYTPAGRVSVTVTKPSPKAARVEIHDSGVGISKETMARLFDKFVRAANASEVNVTGTGLGLYVAKKLIETQGGRIWAESDGEGKGSTFFIELPMKA